MYYLLLFFDTKYTYKEDLINKGYKQINSNDTADEEINENYQVNDLKIQERILKMKEEAFKNYLILDKFFLYDFIRSTILEFSNTWYGFKIFKNNKLLKLHEYKMVEDKELEYNEHYYSTENKFNRQINMIINISYKNIYNFSKSLFYFRSNYEREIKNNKAKETLISETNTIYYNDKSKEIRDQIDIYLEIHNENYYNTNVNIRNQRISLLNIGRNIELKYPNLDDNSQLLYQYLIYYYINIIKIDIVFECLVRRGLLTEYIVRDEKFEKDILKYNKVIYSFYWVFES
jgi:hypothetical protein